jgi:hypothetical protein
MPKRKPQGYEPHVRLYRRELESIAYQSLCPEARALLVELRSLYRGVENRVFMSLREIMKRLNVGRCRAEKARDELIDRGFIRLIEEASFNRKARHAPVYELTNESTRKSGVASKDFMRWRPSEKTTVSTISTKGVDDQHRQQPKRAGNPSIDVDNQHRNSSKAPTLGADHQHTDSLPPHTPSKEGPGWIITGGIWRSRSGMTLNNQCAVCGVWRSVKGYEFDGKRHFCDPVSKRRLARASGSV